MGGVRGDRLSRVPMGEPDKLDSPDAGTKADMVGSARITEESLKEVGKARQGRV